MDAPLVTDGQEQQRMPPGIDETANIDAWNVSEETIEKIFKHRMKSGRVHYTVFYNDT